MVAQAIPGHGRSLCAGWQLCRLVLVIGLALSPSESTGSARAILGEPAQRHLEIGLQLAQEGDLAGAERELQQATDLAPADTHILASFGTVLAMEKKWEESTTIFKKALELEPHDLVLRRYLAANLWQLRRYSEARQNLEMILRESPSDEAARLLLGMVAENTKDYATAARMLGSVPQQMRRQPEAMLALARSYYHIGQRQKARALLGELSENRPSSQAVLQAAEIADETEDYDTAEKLLNSIRPDFPDQAVLGYRLALVEYHRGRFRDSQHTLLDFISAGHASSPIYNLLGWSYYKQNLIDQASHALEQAIELSPREEANYLDLGQILIAHHALTRALLLARQATSRLPHSARLFELQGLVETKLSQFTDAVQSYSRAKQLDRESADAALGLAQAQFSAGMEKESAATFENAIEQFPRQAEFRVVYASVLLKEAEAGSPGAERRAEEMLRSALKLNRSLPSAHFEFGKLALGKGDLPVAIAHLETAVKLDPGNSEAHFALSRAYRRAGRKQDAAREMDLYEKRKEAESPSPPASPDQQTKR